jgi:hypothetical protein
MFMNKLFSKVEIIFNHKDGTPRVSQKITTYGSKHDWGATFEP